MDSINIIESIKDRFTNTSLFGNIRLPHDREEEIHKFLNSIGPYLVMKESTGCQHFHFAFIEANVSRDTIAKKIRTTFPELKKTSVGGSKDYHIAYGKEPRFQLMYIFKEYHPEDNQFTHSNISDFKAYPLGNHAHCVGVKPRALFMKEFAESCQENYTLKKESFKKHVPGQFMEYLSKETQILELKKNGVPDTDLDEGQINIGITHWTSEEFRETLVRHAIGYLKKIDIATCGPNKIWDLVNYAHLHIDEDQYTQHILFGTYRK